MVRKKLSTVAVISLIVTVLGTLLAALGVFWAVAAFSPLASDVLIIRLLLSLILVPLGLSLGWSGFKRLRLVYRAYKYQKILRADPAHSIAMLASLTGKPKKEVLSQLKLLMNERYLTFCRLDAENEHMEFINPGDGSTEAYREPASSATPGITETERICGEYERLLKKLGEIKEKIDNTDITAKVTHLEKLAAEILAAVRSDPEKQQKIRMFVNYYLPETVSLLTSYEQFEEHTFAGDNLKAAKSDIEDILEKLVTGFEKQLDLLYAGDFLDVSSNTDVLETMMSKDGLTEDELRRMTSQK
jgi:hypothetical protein